MPGIEELKEAAEAVIAFSDKLEDALEDGKLTFMEGITIAIGTAPDAFAIVKDAALIKAELLDLDQAELDALVDHIAAEFDLEADGVELAIEAGLDMLVAMYGMIVAIKNARPQDPVG